MEQFQSRQLYFHNFYVERMIQQNPDKSNYLRISDAVRDTIFLMRKKLHYAKPIQMVYCI